MRIGIVVPTMGDRPEWLNQCLASIYFQAGVKPRLVLVSPEPSSVRALADQYDAESIADEGLGLSAAINAGWSRIGDTDALCWLGDDDLLAPDSLSRSAKTLRMHPRASATYGNVRYIDTRGETLFVARPGAFAARYLPWGKDLVPQPGSLFRADAVRAIGPLDERYRYAMDYDYFLRLRKWGELKYVGREVAAFRLHSHGITSNQSGDESEHVRQRVHGPAVNAIRLRLRPLQRMLDHALYRALRAKPGAVPQHNSRCYTCGDGDL